jgi:thiamine biosynthesis lipoprotein
MRSSLSWPSLAIAAALLAAACAPEKRNYDHDFYTFGTLVSVAFFSISEEDDKSAVEALETLFNDVNNNWYPWAPGELQRINNAIAADGSIEVSDRLKSVILAATDYEIISRGRFNAGLGRLSELWGLHDFANPPATLPDSDELASLRSSAPGLKSLQWNRNRLTSRNTDVMIDLGGIAKGSILQDCVALLGSLGINNAIINIGGDLVVMGRVDGRTARIGIRSPSAGVAVAGLDVGDGEAVFTSGTYERFVEIDGDQYPHVLDPSTAYPVTHTSSVTVVDNDPQRADAAATALLVGGVDEFEQLVERLGVRYALLIDAGGDTRLTPAMAERLHWIDSAE